MQQAMLPGITFTSGTGKQTQVSTAALMHSVELWRTGVSSHECISTCSCHLHGCVSRTVVLDSCPLQYELLHIEHGSTASEISLTLSCHVPHGHGSWVAGWHARMRATKTETNQVFFGQIQAVLTRASRLGLMPLCSCSLLRGCSAV